MLGFLKNPSFIKYFKVSLGIIPLVAIIFTSTLTPRHADAGVFSLFGTASGKGLNENAPTTQKMKILESDFSPTLNGQGGPDPITDESALVSSDFPLDSQDNEVTTKNSHGLGSEFSIRVYIVKEGDTLSLIAEKFGVSINTIVWTNELDRKASLKVGRSLTILPVSGIQYTVKKGDTLSGIANRFDAEIADIRDYNDKTDSTLITGEKILIPGAELISTEVVKKTPAQTPSLARAQPAPLSPKPETAEIVNQNVPGVTPPTIGTLARPKSNTGDSSNFIRPIAEGVGRKSQDKHDTWAVDIAAPIGTPIMAAEKGTIILVKPSGYNGGYGKYVVIEHENGVQTLYAHMTTTKVSVGDVVSQGQTIGLVGSTGRSTGPHVHYEVRGAQNNCFKTCE